MNIRPHRSLPLIVVLAAFAALTACSKKEKTDKKEHAEEAAPVDAEAPPVVVAMIDAHGGMPGWRVAKTLSFDSAFHMADDSVTTSSHVTLDLAKRRGYVDFGHNGETMAWDGKHAWSTHWSQPYPPGLRAVLDCYMVQLPWLAMDPGVKLLMAPKDTLWTGPTQYHIVKMSFRPSAPGGPYRLYIDPETKRLHACAFNAAEGEEVVVFGDQAKAEGMMLPTHYAVYNANHTPLAAVTLGNWSSGHPFDENKMSMPDSAVVAQPTP
ncbi:MAG TPA: hypothetical protein VJS69_01050 [Candidatus Krumholzibacteria bacterium]|nr:hypothetical protein [Candidatus Krumholzibacteria bacterium]